MKVIIQCAGNKSPDAGSFSLVNGSRVLFVAAPKMALSQKAISYARPDDPVEPGCESWRDRLVKYNEKDADKNPFNLFPAYRLYSNPVYGRLVEKFGENRIFILSAGWGLIPASFLTPAYDITFSAAGDALNRRKKHDVYRDFCMMEDDGEEILFLGGKSYLPLFHDLTRNMKGQKTVFYNSLTPPSQLLANVKMVRFETTTRTNWHYECANALISGKML